MGYSATFEFDLVIHADKVEEMEREFFRTLQEDDDPAYEPGSFCSYFNRKWGENVAEEDKPVPLMALALGTTRGPVHIVGVVQKSWREWEAPMLEILAPFVVAGGAVIIEGEDGFRTTLEFDGECMDAADEEHIRVSRREELEAKEKELGVVKARLEKAEELLAQHAKAFRVLHVDSVAQVIETFLAKDHPLEQLADYAE